MNNICIFIRTLLSGGAEKQAMLLAKALNKDYAVHLIVWKGNLTEPKFIQFAEENQIKIILLKGHVLTRFSKLFYFLKGKKINIIFSFLASNNFYGAVAGRLSKVDYIVGGIRNAKIPFHKFIIQRFLHNHVLDYTIFNNYSGKDNLIAKGFNKDKCIVIPNCIELTQLPVIKMNKNTINIITVARFVQQKDYPTAIRSIDYLTHKLLAHSNISVHYYIIGHGILENHIRNWINDQQLDDTTTIIINPPNISEYLSGADIYLSTSLFEGTSNSILEAMSHSLPVVATDAGDNAILVDDNRSGYICNIGDHKQIAGKIHDLIIDYDKRQSFGSAGYEKLRNNFTMERFRDKFVSLIESLQKADNLQ